MSKRPYRFNYSDEELSTLVEEYEELDSLRSRAFFQVRLMDIDQALKSLPPREYEAVLLCGPIGLTVRTAGALLGVSAQTMSNRYRTGLEKMARYLNGGS